ncbi:MAG TPA: lamin tail domain-containing protein [Verrucomicrobiales bacterium]|nr:lamin tail domain-containing protein [Verrucomicrobiales bacterium]
MNTTRTGLPAFLFASLLAVRCASAALVGQWTFSTDASDATGNFATGAPAGGATISGGRLHLTAAAGQFLKTGAYTGPAINAKTLIAWVYVTDLSAVGGSVLSLERSAGTDIFDGIVYGERQPLKWMAGSDFWNRTQDVSGPVETATPTTLVQMAIVYGDPVAANNQNRITLYRNGVSYGTYLGGTRQTYSSGVDAIFGKRHEEAGGAAFFTGSIEEARIYDTALTQAEISALSLTSSGPPVISQQPQNSTATEGTLASFSLSLENAAGASFQWRRGTQNIQGATTAGYSLGPVTIGADNGATFDCVVTNGFGSVTSNTVTLTVQPPPPPVMVGQWTFESGAADATGNFAAGVPSNGATITNGVLNLDAGTSQFLQTGAYTGPEISARTLVAWVYINSLSTGGGSVLTLERSAGADVFDGIVYAERQALQWMAGSDGWGRTQDVNGPNETAGPNTLVQMAITYGSTGAGDQNRVTLYRNGQPYGTSYSQGTRVAYGSGTTDVMFGKRHADAGGSSFFSGGIEEARIYDSVLTQGQIASLTPTGFGVPVVSQHPANTSGTEGQTATFTVTLQNPKATTVQWRRNSQIIPGATGFSYTTGVLTIAQDNGAQFDCIVTNPFGSATSNAATLTVTPDVTPPAIAGVSHLGVPTIILVTFTEPVDPVTATNAANYTIAGQSVLSARMGPNGRTVILQLSGLTPNGNYTVQVSGVRDTATVPNTIAAGSSQSFTFSWTPLSTAFYKNAPEAPGPSSRNTGLIISEVMYHPPARGDGRDVRFIELCNTSPWVQELTGWRISGDISYAFPSGTSLAAGGRLVLAGVPADVQAAYGINGVLGPWSGTLGASDGTLRLRNRNDAVLLEFAFSKDAPWPAAPDGFGPSLVLAHASRGEADPAAWAASRNAGGSPGAAEPATVYDALDAIVINEAGANPGFVELFNLSASPADLSGCELTNGQQTFVIPANTSISAQQWMSFPQAAPPSSGGTIVLRSPAGARVLHEMRCTGIPNGASFGFPRDGGTNPFLLASASPGSANTGRRQAVVVLNEIQYNPASGNDEEEFLELRNVSASAVDLSGWRLRGDVDFDFPPGTTLNAGGYLVIAENGTHLLTQHPGLAAAAIAGNYSGKLSNSGGRVSLRSPLPGGGFATEEEVTYGTGGRWGRWSDGGGSSLERVDSRADSRLAATWADSDESAKSAWMTVQTTGVLDNGRDGATALEILLDGPGECLVDDVEVFTTGANLVSNPSFESGLTGWVLQGTHDGSTLRTGEGVSGANSLHVRASENGDPSNRIFTNLTSVPSTGQTATLRAKVRWLHGSTGLRLRLRGNWLEAVGSILTTGTLGTPGTPNSRAAANSGPAIFDVTHSPVLPAAGQPVTLTARVEDPDAVAALLLNYRLDPSPEVHVLSMLPRGGGLFSAEIPAQPAGTLAAFSIEATDAAAAPVTTRFPDNAPAREALVRWGAVNEAGSLSTLNMWMTKATFDQWSSRTKMSNAPLDITVAWRGDRVIYNAGGRFAGSPFHTLGFNGSPGVYDTPTGHWCDYDVFLPEDDLLLGADNTKLSWPGNVGEDGTALRELAANWTAEQMGLPTGPRSHMHLFVNGVRRAAVFENVVQPGKDMLRTFFSDGGSGTLHKVQLWFEFNDPVTSFTHSDARLANWFTTGGARKVARYRANWPRREAGLDRNDFSDLFGLMDTATTTATGDAYTAAIEAVIDIEQWMRVVAFEHVIQNVDSFGNSSYSQNMYAWKPPGGRWVLIPWDNDFAYGGDTGGNLFAINDAMVAKMANHPPFRRHLWRAYHDAANGPLAAANFNTWIDQRYAGLTANNAAVTSPAGIKSNAAARRTYILNQLATVAASFAANAPATSSEATINVTGTAPVQVKTIEINGLPVTPRWTSLTAWTVPFVLKSGGNSLLVRALDTNGTVIGSANLTSQFTGTVQWPALRLNEWMAANSGAVRDPADNDSDDWFEIYNPTAAAVNLQGWSLKDSGAVPYVIPAGYTIPAGGRLVVWADDETDQNTGAGELHVSFKLSSDGESLTLLAPDSTVVDTVTFGAQVSDVSQGRTPDGGTDIVFLTTPTAGQSNAPALPPPAVTSVTQAGGQVTLTFTTVAGFSYQSESSADLAVWAPAGQVITGDGTEKSVSVIVTGNSRRFLRITRTP